MGLSKSEKNDIAKTRGFISMIKKGYGSERCETLDWEDFPTLRKRHKKPSGRCASCAAWEVIDWLEGHIDLIKFGRMMMSPAKKKI